MYAYLELYKRWSLIIRKSGIVAITAEKIALFKELLKVDTEKLEIM